MKFSRAKLQHLKWVRRKELIRINCFIMIAILLIVLFFMGFPIVSDATPAYQNLKDFCYISELCNLESCKEYFANNNSSLPSDQWYERAFLPFDDAMNYYDDVQYMINDFNVSYFSGTGLNNNAIDGYFTIYTLSNDDSKLALCLGYPEFNCRYGNYEISCYGATWYYDRVNKTFSDYHSATYVSNMGKILVSNYDINAIGYYQSGGRWSSINTTNINYSYLNGSNKYGSNLTDTGFDVNNPAFSSIQDHKKPYQGSCVYMQYSNLNTGNMHIVVKSDEFQKTENASIKLKCSVSSQVRQNSASYRSNIGVDGAYQNNFTVPNETFNIGTFSEYDIPLSSFNNTGDYSISLDNINKGLWNNNEKSLYSFNSCFENTSQGTSQVTKSTIFSLLSITNFIYPYENISDTSFTLLSEVWDVQVVFCIGDYEEIFDSFQLDMISGSVQNQDYSLPNEDDIKNALDVDVVPNNYSPQPYQPIYPDAYNITVPNNNTDVNNDNSNSNESNDNITVSGGENSVNVVTNINQGNKYPEKGVMQSFVRIINNDKNNTVKDIDTMIGGSAYIQLMNNALVAVPDQVWSIWITALKAILGIAVSAFFLKILINWAT